MAPDPPPPPTYNAVCYTFLFQPPNPLMATTIAISLLKLFPPWQLWYQGTIPWGTIPRKLHVSCSTKISAVSSRLDWSLGAFVFHTTAMCVDSDQQWYSWCGHSPVPDFEREKYVHFNMWILVPGYLFRIEHSKSFYGQKHVLMYYRRIPRGKLKEC